MRFVPVSRLLAAGFWYALGGSVAVTLALGASLGMGTRAARMSWPRRQVRALGSRIALAREAIRDPQTITVEGCI